MPNENNLISTKRQRRIVKEPDFPLPEGYRREFKDKVWFTYDDTGKPICGARYNKQRGRQGFCKRSPTVGRNRCNLHGGHTPRGIESPHFVSGRYSKDVIGQLQTRYEKAVSDPDILQVRDEIGLVESRIADLLSRLDIGESKQLWERLKRVYGDVKVALKRGDTQAVSDALNQMGIIINKATDYHRSWDEILKAVSVKAKLSETEQKRLVAMKQMVTVEETMGMLASVVAVIRENITDRDTLVAIAGKISEIATSKGIM